MDSAEKGPGQDYFTSLNDDCILEIFDRLSLDSLCEISVTCKRLHVLAGNYYQRKYPELVSRTVRIENIDGRIRFRGPEKYAKYFSKHAKSVVYFGHYEKNEQLVQFMRSNFSKNIKKFSFYGVNRFKSIGREIREFLQQVEILSCTIVSNRIDVCFDDILNNVPRVKILHIDLPKSIKKVKMPRIEMSCLEVLWFRSNFSLVMNELERFLQCNSTIKRLTFELWRAKTNDVKKLFEIVIRSKIVELFVEFCSESLSEEPFLFIDFGAMRKEVEMLDECEHFKRLEVRFDFNRTEGLGVYLLSLMGSWLRAFKGLHIHNLHNRDGFTQFLRCHTHLTVLSIDQRFKEVNHEIHQLLSKELTNLEEFYYYRQNQHGQITSNVKEIISFYVRNTRKLYKIVVLNLEAEDSSFNALEFSEQRKKLNDGIELTIYVASDKKETTTVSDNASELVTIKRISIVYSDELDLPNPFIRYRFNR